MSGSNGNDMRWRIANGKHRKPQIDALVTRFRALGSGQRITHAEISAVIGETANTSGYRTVVQRAKREAEKEFVVMRSVPREGYERPNGDAQVSTLRDRTHRGIKVIAKSGVIAAGTAETDLTDQGRKIREHVVMSTAKIVEHYNESRRQLSVNLKGAERLPGPK
jgi:hypothetical protein